jgi:transcriptional regulator with XRE-family HTH domain
MPSAFAQLLKRERTARGLTQHELATRAGVSYHNLRAVERGGITSPSAANVARLAAALNLDAEVLLVAFVSAPTDPDPIDDT